jgi:signal transduction histidine kinase
LVKHRSGSLESALAGARLRNLAISFTILLLLAVSMVTIIVSTRRAQNLARLQMEFVAGVSHELLTPLAVIHSAGDNLADGLVLERCDVREYGQLITRESRRLTGMVQETLEFAAAQFRETHYDLRELDTADLLRRTMERFRSAASEAGVEVFEDFEPGLLPVMGDAAALTRCVGNLLSNALKYGRDGRWIGIRARNIRGAHGTEVEISVEDKGPGIAPGDVPHIFELFYRGRKGAAS